MFLNLTVIGNNLQFIKDQEILGYIFSCKESITNYYTMFHLKIYFNFL